jgi:hypothetical protein
VHDRQQALDRAQRDAGDLTRIIAEQTTRAISDTDRILNFLAYDLGRLGPVRPKLVDVLRNATSESDLLLQLSYTDASGDAGRCSAAPPGSGRSSYPAG